ncbi:MAG: asparaginase [Gemmatimonadetes bacterium]|nr:asparaginase [Gemmatimonadota bacterium]MCC6773110.1 asparaginase [Gemmatimonadaceae bacterium]
MRVVALVFTGGTISMRFDASIGGAVPALGADEIIAAARGIEHVATLRVEEWGRLPGPHMTVDRMWALRARLLALVADPAISGVVVTHGTDTIEESAYLAIRSIATDKPIVFTGAMRNSSELSWDGPANLSDSVRVAASDAARGHGALVMLNGRVFSALDVTKAHTHLLDAFESPGLGPIGVVDDGEVVFRRSLPPFGAVLTPSALATPVDIVTAYAGADARFLDVSRATARGVVVAALGRGNVPPAMAEGIARCLGDGVPVVIASRAPRGRVGTTYGYEGGGRQLANAGAIFTGARRPQQARIDLMLALGAGLTGDALRVVFDA